MVNIERAVRESGYTAQYIRTLVRSNRVIGKRIGRQVEVDLKSLMRYRAGVKRGRPRKAT